MGAAIMASKRVINIKSVAADIQSGLSDTELMEKYGLTSKNLSTVLDKLLEYQLITFDDLQQRQAEFEEEEVYTPPSEFRAWERDEVDFPLRLHDEADPQVKGVLLNVSERGLGVKGIRATVGDVKTFVIHADEVFEVDPVVCEVNCRWIKLAREDRGCLSGYEVVKFLSGDLKTIQVLMKGLTLEERIALKEKREI